MVEVSGGKPIWTLGLMSGTSMDGIDAALILTDGETIAEFGPSLFVPYTGEYRAQMQTANLLVPEMPTDVLREPARWPGELRRLAESAVEVHLGAIAALGGAPELIGFHGQTVTHRPGEGFTLQLGDGAAVAWGAGVTTVWDFRSADMAAGGQGAPLAPFYHHALARRAGLAGPVVFLNLGGVANLTWVGDAMVAPEAPGALLAFDTGPANAMVDDFVVTRTGAAFYRDGAMAAAGQVDDELLDQVSSSEFLSTPPPKSLDRNDFTRILDAVAGRSDVDGAATLTAFSAACVARAVPHLPASPTRWLVCGGGRKNTTLMRMLAERLAAPVEPVEAVGLDGDMAEAQAFAYLAVRVQRGLPTSAPGTTGCSEPVCGGRIAVP